MDNPLVYLLVSLQLLQIGLLIRLWGDLREYRAHQLEHERRLNILNGGRT